MTPSEWIGRLAELRDRRWRKPQQVRIDDMELAAGVCNHDPRCGTPDSPHVWFWARYA